MKIVFNINYHTSAQQKLCIVGSIPELGALQPLEAKEMNYVGDGFWTLQVDISFLDGFEYQYFLKDINGEMVFEPWKRKHCITFTSAHSTCILYDYWHIPPLNIVNYTSAFTKNLFVHQNKAAKKVNFNRTLTMRVLCPCVRKDEQLFISGNQDWLGNWNPEFAKRLDCSNFPEWEIQLNADDIIFPIEYKFLIRDKAKTICRWESGDNRIIGNVPENDKTSILISEFPFRDVSPAWKGAGTVIPVFSLRSEHSFGIGDMHDLKLLIDWANQTNQCLVQILPMNDTTRTHAWTDSYPYSAISIYALHPIYISLPEMGMLNNAEQKTFFQEIQQTLNLEDTVNYESVDKFKMQYCHAFFEQEGTAILESKEFKLFYEKNQMWLDSYAVFCYYRDQYHTSDFSHWGKDALYNAVRIEELCESTSEAYPDISFVYFLQFILHNQFKAVSDYAREKGVILKGDLPIGINRTSVEAWVESSYFNIEGQAGAPPDFFSDTGQNWSFPTYNWDVMEKDEYVWWRKRFRKLDDYFDCFRIDHILGFFRIWEIPIDYVQGLCGHFRPALPLSVDEIEGYGFKFDKRYTKPRVRHRLLLNLFGDKTEEVMNHYFSPVGGDYMVLNSSCDTQRKIDKLFQGHTDEASLLIKNALFTIANDVLFLEDPYETAKFHPRILAFRSFAYQELTDQDQAAFDKLSYDFFYIRHNGFWKTEALKHLTPLISTTEMLICGEDLGMIPDSVHEVMNELNILSLELERTPKISGKDFTDLQVVPYLSVCTTSTHDMNPLRSWWKENFQRTQQYYQSVLCREGSAPEECTSELAEQIIANHLKASSMLTIIPLQDWFSISDTLKQMNYESERINNPENPNHYWCYRMHITLENLLQATDFNQKIRNMISNNGR